MFERDTFEVEFIEYTQTGVTLHYTAGLTGGGTFHGKQEIPSPDATFARKPYCSYMGCNHKGTAGWPFVYCTCHGVDGTPCPDAEVES